MSQLTSPSPSNYYPTIKQRDQDRHLNETADKRKKQI